MNPVFIRHRFLFLSLLGGLALTLALSLVGPAAQARAGLGLAAARSSEFAPRRAMAVETRNNAWSSPPVTSTLAYTVTLVEIPGATFASPADINDAGQVAGTYPNPGDNFPLGFLWEDGSVTYLEGLGGYEFPKAINASGQIVGDARTSDNYQRAVRWINGTIDDLGTLGGDEAIAFGVNNSGAVVGWAEASLANSDRYAFLYQGGQMQSLGFLGTAYDINDTGQVVGIHDVSGQPFLWMNGQLHLLGTLGGNGGQANAINEDGQVVGSSATAQGTGHAILWENGTMEDLGTLSGTSSSVAFDINDRGQVVGSSGAAPFLWQDGVMHDLNDLIPPGTGWDLYRAEAINNQGQIVGYGTLNGVWHGFLLTPERQWTLMFYLDGDNNLSDSYFPILERLELGADNPRATAVVLWDSLAATDSVYLEVQYDTNLNQPYNYQEGENRWSLGELDMADPDTLADFITWAVVNYPAEHYALIASDHGTGLGGGLCDTLGANNACATGGDMDLAEMQQALAAAQSQTGEKLDVLYMDMCLMGMLEDGYQFKDYADYYVASESIQWGFDEPYTAYVSGIEPGSTPAEVATLFASAYGDVAYQSWYPYPSTISAVDLTQISTVVTATNTLAAALDVNLTAISTTLTLIAHEVQRFDNKPPGGLTVADTYIDLYHFAGLVEAYINEPDVIAAAQQVQQALLDYVIYEAHNSTLSVDLSNSHGVSIFFPATSSSFYNPTNYDFAVGADWGLGGGRAPGAGGATWAGMLGRYFQLTQPGGPDDPTPPLPQPRLIPNRTIFLPLVVR